MLIIFSTGVDLIQAVDRWKCQTLFLSQISQKALRRALFPVGDLKKDVVKAMAIEAGLEKIAHRKEVGKFSGQCVECWVAVYALF